MHKSINISIRVALDTIHTHVKSLKGIFTRIQFIIVRKYRDDMAKIFEICDKSTPHVASLDDILAICKFLLCSPVQLTKRRKKFPIRR